MDNNANRSIQQRTEKQPENKSVEPDKNASRGNSDRSINQNKTLDDNQPKAKQIKRTKTVNKKTDKSESKNRKATLNEKKE
ncbi:MAG: hypothetical protein PHS59_17655 [Paludibacter sp.]|nr:hypothetical protein [Paludibacter sp.]